MDLSTNIKLDELDNKLNCILEQNNTIIKQNSINEMLNCSILSTLGLKDDDISRLVKKIHREVDLQPKFNKND